jgi:hypothetical protein
MSQNGTASKVTDTARKVGLRAIPQAAKAEWVSFYEAHRAMTLQDVVDKLQALEEAFLDDDPAILKPKRRRRAAVHSSGKQSTGHSLTDGR